MPRLSWNLPMARASSDGTASAPRRWTVVAWLGISSLVTGCYGGLERSGRDAGGTSAGSAGDSAGVESGGANGSGDSGGDETDGDPSADPECTQAFEPAEARLRRLTQEEYARSIEHLMQTTVSGAPIPPDHRVDGERGYTSFGAVAVATTELDVEQYEAIAHGVTSEVFADTTHRAALVGCEPTEVTDPCIAAFVTSFGRRAWRRPLSAAESEVLVTVARDVGTAFDVWTGLQHAAAAVLQSAHFLYRVELGETDPEDGSRLRYTAFEMASRLSFSLWNQTPDDELLEAATQGSLLTEEGIRAQAERLLADPRSIPAVQRFFGEYLSVAALDGLFRDATVFPQFTDALGGLLRTELERVLEDVVFTRRESWLSLLDNRQTFLNAELAELYELPFPGADPNAFVAVTLPEDGPRAGLLTMGAFDAIFGAPEETSPVKRGRFIRQKLLCQDIPDPPPDAQAMFPDVDRSKTMRERFEMHTASPSCRACHGLLDPLGLPLEAFDSIGAHRTTDRGQPLDLSGELDGLPFWGARELGELLKQDDRVDDCVARHVYRYLGAHEETRGERPALCGIRDAFRAADHDFLELLLAILTSDGFRYAAIPSP